MNKSFLLENIMRYRIAFEEIKKRAMLKRDLIKKQQIVDKDTARIANENFRDLEQMVYEQICKTDE
jgi:hypothetical protein